VALRIVVYLVLSAAAALMTACGRSEGAFATVGNQSLDLECFQEHVTLVTGEAWQGVGGRVGSRLLDQFLDQEVVVAAARKGRSVDVPADPGERLAVVRSLLGEVCGSSPAPSVVKVEEEIARRLAVPRPARARARQMLLDSREEALAALARLESGEDFVAVSREVSRAANAATGGNLGMVTQGSLPVMVDEVIFSLAAGQISEPVESPAGFHVVQVLKVVPAGTPSRDEVEPAVRRTLAEELGLEFTSECVGSLAAELGVVVDEEFLWFRYDGRYAEDEYVED